MMKMNTAKIGRIVLFVVLVMGVVLMSGCIGDPEETTPEGTSGGDEPSVTASDTGETAKTTSDTPELPTGTEAGEEESFFGSMRDLINKNEPLRCTYGYVMQTGEEANGVFYVADNKARNEVEVIYAEGKVYMDSIIIGDWVYLQHNLLPWSLKIHVNDLQDDVYDQDEVVNLNEKKEFKCQSWAADNSKFVVPDDIEFEDMTEALREYHRENPVEEVISESNQRLCDICREYRDKEKEAKCLADYKCE